jgi:two-component system catabolic regulation response regulator CreB/two-component system response regulator ChvI
MQNQTRILIVDDDPDIGFTLKVGLEDLGYEVSVFNNPITVLDNFKAHYYDLLIIDIRMPNMSGFELYMRLREIDRKFRICFITAFETYYRSLLEFFPTMDVNCFIRKPITIEELNNHILKELGR